MKRKMTWVMTLLLCAAALALTIRHNTAQAQEPNDEPIRRSSALRGQDHETSDQTPSANDAFDRARRPSCTNGTGAGTYGYHMRGSIVGVGPFLVNGLFTLNHEGTSSGLRVMLTINGQTFPATGVNGTFTTNDDCTGSGMFFVPELNQQITYNSILTDGGNQIELLNTNEGIVLQGYGRRIALLGRRPNCTNGTILGNYGYRLDGSTPGAPSAAGAGLLRHSLDGSLNGVISGFDAISFNGSQLPRRDYQGTYQVNSDCTGTARYTDSLGQTVNYVFTVVDKGEEIYLMGANNDGVSISGTGRRVK